MFGLGRIRPPWQIALPLIAILLLSYLSLALGLTISKSPALKASEAAFDSRITGAYRDGWIGKKMIISDADVVWWSARAKVSFDSWRPGAAGPAHIRITGYSPPLERFIDSSDSVIFGFRPLDLSPAQTPPTNFIVRLVRYFRPLFGGGTLAIETLNPIAAVRGGSRLLGVKFQSIEIAPRFGLLLPEAKFCVLPVLMISSLLLLISAASYRKSDNTISPLAIIIASLLIALALGSGDVDIWAKLAPAWCLAMAIAFGAILFGQYSNLKPPLSDSQALESDISSNKAVLYLVVITILAFLLRLKGIDFGLPYFFHPDEERKVNIVWRMLHSPNLDPEYFRHPSFLLYGATFGSIFWQKLSGSAPTLSSILLAGRFVSVLFGSLSIVIFYLLGRELFSRTTALCASFLLAFAPLHVVCSRYFKEDASLIFFLLLTLYLVVAAVKQKSVAAYVAAGFSAGVTTSTKYTGMLSIIYLFIPMAIALISFLPEKIKNLTSGVISPAESIDRTLAIRLLKLSPLVLILIPLGFLLITPYALINRQTFLEDFLWEKNHMNQGHATYITAQANFWMYHLRHSIGPGLTFPVTLLSLVACGWLIKRRRFSDLLILASILLFYLPAEWVKAKPAPQPERYILPCLPFLLLALASFFTALTTRLRSNNSQLILYPLILLCFLAPAGYSIGLANSISDDTREQAARWISNELAPGSTVVVDWASYGPALPDQKYKTVQLVSRSKLFDRLATDEIAQATGGKLLALSSFYYDRFIEGDALKIPSRGRRFVSFFNKETPLKVFSNPRYSYGFHNPTIQIFALENQALNQTSEIHLDQSATSSLTKSKPLKSLIYRLKVEPAKLG